MLCPARVRVREVYIMADNGLLIGVTSEPFEVPVQEGCATYVMYGQGTVAIVTQPMTIQIPKGMKVSTKGSTGDEISIEYEVLNDTDAKIAYN